jgi:hypothetical protein
MPSLHYLGGAVQIINDRFWVVGGKDHRDQFLTMSHVFDDGTWTSIGSCVTAINQQIGFIVGGKNSDMVDLKQAWGFDFLQQDHYTKEYLDIGWSKAPGMKTPRFRPACGSYQDANGNHFVLVVGGEYEVVGHDRAIPLNSVEKYDVARHEWTFATSLGQHMSWGTMVNIKGRLLLFGGKRSDMTAIAGVQEYDYSNNTWIENGLFSAGEESIVADWAPIVVAYGA